MTYFLALFRMYSGDVYILFKIDRHIWNVWIGGFITKAEILTRAFLEWDENRSPAYLVDYHNVSDEFVEKYEHLYSVCEPSEDLI